ncbi:MAG: chemotaxis protein CheB [Desulfococcaceae bacterium]|jgi:PAS domain S-box-containing protein|nr:chemotaxis protein CheB [Desulfococcaceae bacterium]
MKKQNSTEKTQGQVPVPAEKKQSIAENSQDNDISAISFPVVGIGASAGGLAALEAFFAAMPPDSGMAFVVVQHLSPDFKSLMDDLLARHTDMPIYRVEDGLTLEADSVYLIPPKRVMTMAGGRLFLRERVTQHLVLPVDIFFESLAVAAGALAVGIVLSGTGTDGSRGIQAIHDAGGLVLAQTVESAQFDGMPRAAISTGVCNYILAPADMPALLLDYIKDPNHVCTSEASLKIKLEEGEYAEIFAYLRRSYGLDFSKYKPATVGRRISRRMELHRLHHISDYVAMLAANPLEIDALYKDLLIGVTEFFRDPKVFSYMEEEVIPSLFSRAEGESLRVWIAGCATGEEAYSLAVLLHERAETLAWDGKITIFATDVHRHSLETASAGEYERDRLLNISPQRLERYFVSPMPGRYKIIPELRKLVVFAPHNLISDPPFTKMDLVCCRNLLIYFLPETQEQVLARFHFALRPGGVLFLGLSEGTGKLFEEFDIIHGAFKIYRKKRDIRLGLDIGENGTVPLRIPAPAVSVNIRNSVALDRRTLHDYDLLLNRYIPAGVLLNEHRQVLHYFGDVHRYLKPLMGRAEKDFLHMLDGDLHLAVSVALQRVISGAESVSLPNVAVPDEKEFFRANVRVEILPDEKEGAAHYHVSFIPVTAAEPAVELLPAPPAVSLNDHQTIHTLQTHIGELETELQSKKENLQATVEELQTSNEELQAANEELLASNEELQSTNEELHSVNEELYTVNAEFEKKNNELQSLNRDHEHLLSSLEVGVVFVDEHLVIRKFNPASAFCFKLMPQDIGRPIDHIAYQLTDQARMLADVRGVLTTGHMTEKEVRTQDGLWLLQRLVPFRGEDRIIRGVILTFTDISSIKSAETEMQKNFAEYKTTLDNLPIGVLVHAADKGIILSNPQTDSIPGLKKEEAEEGQGMAAAFDFVDEKAVRLDPEDYPVNRILTKGEALKDCVMGIMHRESAEITWVRVNGVPVFADEGRVEKIIINYEDITLQKQAEKALWESLEKYRVLFASFPLGITITDEQGQILESNPEAERILELSPETQRQRRVNSKEWQLIRPDGTAMPPEEYASTKALQEKRVVANREMGLCKGDKITWLNVTAAPIPVKGYGIAITYNDVTERKQAEDALKASEERQRTAHAFAASVIDSLSAHICVLDQDGIILQVNRAWQNFADANSPTAGRYFLGWNYFDICQKAISGGFSEALLFMNGIAEIQNGDREHFSMEYPCDSPAEQRWFLCHITRFYEEGKLRFVVTQENISARKYAEKALSESEKKYRTLVEKMPIPICFVNRQKEMSYINPCFTAFFGYPHEEVSTLAKWSRRAYPDRKYRQQAKKRWKKAFKEAVRNYSDIRQEEYCVSCKNGEIRIVEIGGMVLESGFLAMFIDLTERKKAQKELEDALARIQAIFQTIPAHIIVTDTEYNIIDTNISGKVLRNLGFQDKSQIIGRKCYETHKKSNNICPGCNIRRCFQSGKQESRVSTLEEEMLLGYPTKVFATPIRDKKGKIIGAVECSMDISDLRDLEKRLRKAKETAEIATSAKSEFLASMSHEIRTPMNVIIGMSRLIRETELTAQQREYADMVYESSEILLSLIEDILDFSKIEAGKIELEYIDFDLKTLLVKTAGMLKLKASEKGLLLQYRIPENIPPFVKGDPVRLRQVILNLVNNAVKFTEKGEITLEVSLERETDRRIKLRFSVTDTGIGIPADRLERLFRPFSQADSSISRKYGGTGLGLAISYNIVKLMDGRMTVESEAGKGSSFVFTACFEKSEGIPERAEGEKDSAASVSDLSGLRILLAEDNAFNRRMAHIILKKSGLCVESAVNGKEAAAAVRKGNYDLVLMDIRMPVMDGLSATKRIRETGNRIPVIALTANATAEDRAACMAVGMDDYISKPLDPIRLARVIRKHIGERKESSPAPSETAEQEDFSSENILPGEIPVIDFQELEKRLGRDEKLLGEIIRQLPAELSAYREKLQRALEKKDAAEAEAAAHSIKGLCANTSAKKMAETASRAEQAAKKGKTEVAAAAASELEHDLAALHQTLSARFPDFFPGPEEKKTEVTGTDTKEKLMQLPASLRAELKETAEQGDPGALKEVISRIRDKAPSLADVLEKMVDEFRFDIFRDISVQIKE